MKTLLSIIFIFGIVINVNAQRQITHSTFFVEYRPIGETRLWTFIMKDSTLGHLISTVKGKTKINGVDGYIMKEQLTLDFNKIRTPLKMNIENEHYVTSAGFYLGDYMKLNINNQHEELNLKRSGDDLKGYSTRGGNKIKQSHQFKKDGFALQENFFDQYELFLAMHDIKVGDVIEDSIFMPQAMIKEKVRAEIKDFINLRVYNNVFDSAFVIHYTEPQEQYQYFTPDKRLIKVVIPSQGLKVYLDAVQKPKVTKQAATKHPKPLSKILSAYFIYFVFGLLSVLFFVQHGYRWRLSYISFLAGGLLFGVMIFTQIPLQMSIIKNIFTPHIKEGGSLYVWGIGPALSVGVIQEICKVVLIYIIIRVSNFKKERFVVIGAMLGAGFGLVEACYLIKGIDVSQLFGLNLIERAFTILFHTTSGALMGYALGKNIRKIIMFLVILIIINTLFHYLPVLAFSKLFLPALLNIVLAFISLILLFGAMLVFKKEQV